jgi:hypothetical protein
MELRHKKEALARAGVEQGSRKLTTAAGVGQIGNWQMRRRLFRGCGLKPEGYRFCVVDDANLCKAARGETKLTKCKLVQSPQAFEGKPAKERAE